MKELVGTGVALCTPFNAEGKIDFPALEKLVEYNIQGGVEYLVALGTTSETATLDPQEKKEVLDCIKKTNANRLPIVLGIGGNNTYEIAKEINRINSNDYLAILSVSPYYNKPNQDGIYHHYKYLAENTSAKIIMYNVPGRTGSNMSPSTTIKLAENFPSLIAIKDAPLQFRQFLDLIQNKPDDFLVISGDDTLALSAVLAGASGVISVIGQALPQEFSEMIRLGINRQVDPAFQIQYKLMNLIDFIFEEGNPAGIKALLEIQQIMNDITRLPLTPASEVLKNKLDKELQKQLFSYNIKIDL